MVAAQAHQNGSRTSASSPSSMKTVQKIFFCMGAILRAGALIEWGASLFPLLMCYNSIVTRHYQPL